MEEYREIIINWSKAISIDNFRETEIEKHNVLYQLYGDHHIYGRDTLLYIGVSKNCDNRLKQHVKGVFGYVNNLKISIGHLEDYDGSLEIPESILIANHKPSFNKDFIHDLHPDAKKHKIIVLNSGINGMLKTSCTNFWWIHKYKIQLK